MPTLNELLQKSKQGSGQAQSSSSGRTLESLMKSKSTPQAQQEPQKKGLFDKVKDFGSRFLSKAGDTVDEAFGNIQSEIKKDVSGEQSKTETFYQSVGEGSIAFAKTFGNLISTVYEELPQETRSKAEEFGGKIMNDLQKQAEKDYEEFKREEPEGAKQIESIYEFVTNPEFQRNAKPIIGLLEVGGISVGGNSAYNWVRKASNKTMTAAENVAVTIARTKTPPKAVPKKPGSFLQAQNPALEGEIVSGTTDPIDDLVRQLEKTRDPKESELISAQLLERVEASATNVTFREKTSGMREDIKKRIVDNPEGFLTYKNVAQSRNKNDTLPPAYGYGAQRVQLAESIIEDILNDAGSKIGQFRTQHKDTLVNTGALADIEQTFSDELNKLNLMLDNNKIVQMPGEVNKVTSPAELIVLEEMKENLDVIYKNPTIENIIENRTIVDKKINFGKDAREISDQLDGLNKNLRAELAKANRASIPEDQVELLEEYSRMITALTDIKDYTKRKAGAEYLIRLVLSGRGREALDVIKTVKKETGIDLLDDAQFAKTATKLYANDDQMNLLEQQLKASGLDIGALLRGDKVGAAASLFKKGVDKFFDPASIFEKTAQEAKESNKLLGPTR